jgi:hypothetical protein
MWRKVMLLVWSVVDETSHISGEQKIDNPHTDGLESWRQTRQWAKITPAYMSYPRVILHPRDCHKRLHEYHARWNILRPG